MSNRLEIEKVSICRARCKVVAVVPIHQIDASLFLDQLFQEFKRLDWEVVWHINHVSDTKLIQRIIEYPRTIGYTLSTQDSRPFLECDRRDAWDIAQQSGASWLVNHDADETWEPAARQILPMLMSDRCLHLVRWYNIWEKKDDGTLLIRADPPFVGYRPRLYPIGPWRFEYRPVAQSTPYAIGKCPAIKQSNLRVLHWGFSTPELRQWHYAFWHHRYSHSNFWRGMTQTVPALREFDPNVGHQEWMRQEYLT